MLWNALKVFVCTTQMLLHLQNLVLHLIVLHGMFQAILILFF